MVISRGAKHRMVGWEKAKLCAFALSLPPSKLTLCHLPHQREASLVIAVSKAPLRDGEFPRCEAPEG